MSDIKILTADDILKANDLPRETVEVPEWGGSVIVQGLTAWDRSELENEMLSLDTQKIKVGKKGKRQERDIEMGIDMRLLRVKLSAMCMVNEKGERLFGPSKVELLGKKSPGALDRVFMVAMRINGFTADDVEEAGED